MVKFIFIIGIIFFSLSVGLLSQTENINQRNEELANLRKEVSRLEKQLQTAKESTQKTLKVLNELNEQRLYLNKIINELKKQEIQKENVINRIMDSITNFKNSIEELENNYAQLIRWTYIHGRESKFKLLFTSGSVNQAIIRYKYLHLIADQTSNLKSELRKKISLLSEIQSRAEKEKEEKKILVRDKEAENKRLILRKNEKEELISQMKKDQLKIEEEISEKRKAEIQIKELIARLIEEDRERERRARESKLKGLEEVPGMIYNYSKFENFNDLKGKLFWPIRNGRVIRKFGENKNEKLKTITLNYGIDISASSDENVYAVAEGVVSAINWIPGYGSVVIITHRDNYRTVYGHITDISVSEGDLIKGGDLIGKVNDSLEGNIMHFEVWKERNYQNPEEWLVSK